MKSIRTQLIVTALGTLVATGLVQAQPTAHYVPGAEGIKAASLPPPGVYLRDYNMLYFANQRNDAKGNEIPGVDPDVFIYANIPRVIWITDLKLLGGYIGVDGLLPLPYKSVEANTPAGHVDESTFGIGDLFGEVTWSAHTKKFDFSLAYGVWAPTGDFSTTDPSRAGNGYWTHMFTAGATWYLDADKKFAVSALNRYEINMEQEDTDVTPGNAWTLEWGASYALKPTIDVGVVGYYQLQTTLDGNSSNDERDQVAAIGPEVSMFCTKLGLNTSLRYLYEFMAEDRFQGHTVTLTFTKPF